MPPARSRRWSFGAPLRTGRRPHDPSGTHPDEDRVGRRGSRRDEAAGRRRRTVAVFSAAGILAGTYAVTASQPLPPPPPERALALPEPGSEDEWVARAQVTLTSLNRQLDTIAQTEEAWSRQPPQQRAAPPRPVVQMQERKSLLERRKATIQSQLDTYRSRERTRNDLEMTEQHLQAVERALEDAPPELRRNPEQASVIAALDEQRDLRLRQREARRAELESLEEGVRKAVETPLPDDGEQTREVSRRVREVIETGDDEGSGEERSNTPDHPEVVTRDERREREREDVPNGAPPDPRGPGDETAGGRNDPDVRAHGPRDGSGGPLAGAVDAVGGVLGGGGAEREGRARGQAGGRGGAGGPVGAVTDTPDGVARGGRPSGKAGKNARGGESRGTGGPVGAVTDAAGDVAGGGSRGGRDRGAGRGRSGVVDTVGGAVGDVVGGEDGGKKEKKAGGARAKSRGSGGSGKGPRVGAAVETVGDVVTGKRSRSGGGDRDDHGGRRSGRGSDRDADGARSDHRDSRDSRSSSSRDAVGDTVESVGPGLGGHKGDGGSGKDRSRDDGDRHRSSRGDSGGDSSGDSGEEKAEKKRPSGKPRSGGREVSREEVAAAVVASMSRGEGLRGVMREAVRATQENGGSDGSGHDRSDHDRSDEDSGDDSGDRGRSRDRSDDHSDHDSWDSGGHRSWKDRSGGDDSGDSDSDT